MPLTTGRPGLKLAALTEADPDAVYALVQANRTHLTRHGDFQDFVDATRDEQRVALRSRAADLSFGVYEHQDLVGAVELIAVDPPRYGLGYWLAASACHRGIATLALAAVLTHARDTLGATDGFAGVTHSNEASMKVLSRAGFRHIETFSTHQRYHRNLRRRPPSDHDR